MVTMHGKAGTTANYPLLSAGSQPMILMQILMLHVHILTMMKYHVLKYYAILARIYCQD